jgi:proteasome lid subunit RPN8/RPN11
MNDTSTVVMSEVLSEDLFDLCWNRLPYETCGIIYGSYDNCVITADGISIIGNTSPSRESSFSFHPEDWIQAFFEAQKNQRRIVGFFHSHPLGSAHPSPLDAKGWIPWGTYWIVSLSGTGRDITVYRADPIEQWVRLPLIREP